jgi:hypothetical protein
MSILALAASALPVSAQDAQDGQLWLNTTLFGSVDRLAFFAEVQPRFGNDISRLDQLILRPAIGWKFGEELTIYQGYARVENTPAGAPAVTEDRSFQQAIWEIGKVEGVKLSSRTRFEQRWLSDGRDTGFRLREMLRASYPLFGEGSGIAAVGWSEIFVALNDTDWRARAGFDRIRTFEIGYINQTVNAAAARVEMDHIISLNLSLRY